MRVVLALILIVAVMFFVGWLTFRTEDGRSTINIETREIEEDTRDATEAGKSALHDAAQGTRELIDRADRSLQEQDVVPPAEPIEREAAKPVIVTPPPADGAPATEFPQRDPATLP